MSEITTIGLDLAKHVFQVHGVDAIEHRDFSLRSVCRSCTLDTITFTEVAFSAGGDGGGRSPEHLAH